MEPTGPILFLIVSPVPDVDQPGSSGEYVISEIKIMAHTNIKPINAPSAVNLANLEFVVTLTNP